MTRIVPTLVAGLLLLGSAAGGYAQTLNFNLNPSLASTAGGTVVRFPRVADITSVTIDGQTVALVPDVGGAFVTVVAPAHAAGVVDLVATAATGVTGTRQLTYVDFPRSGLATPIARISLTSTGDQATRTGSNGNGFGSRPAAVTGDGRAVLFLSDAIDLVPGQEPYGASDLYLKNLDTGVLTYAGYCNDCASTVTSLDGSIVAWRQVAMAQAGSIWVKRGTSAPVWLDRNATGSVFSTMAMSGDGRYLAFGHTAYDIDATPVESDRNSMDLFVAGWFQQHARHHEAHVS